MKKIQLYRSIGMLAFVLCCACLVPTFGAAATENGGTYTDTGQYTETVEYTSQNKDQPYTFAESVSTEEGTFKLKDVVYDITDQPVMETQIVLLENLYEQNAETEQTKEFINANGQTATGTLADVSYSETIITDRSALVESETRSGYVIAQPAAAMTKTVSYEDTPSGQTLTPTLPLSDFRITTPYHWEADVNVPMRIEVYDATLYMLNGRYVPYNDEKPALAGYEADILTILNLPQESYRITDFVWTGDVYTENGVQYRNAVATGERYVAEYTAYYSDTIPLPDAPGYDASLSYSLDSGDTEYLIRATAIYEKEGFPVVPVVITVVSVLVGIGTAVLILYLIAKKRKKK